MIQGRVALLLSALFVSHLARARGRPSMGLDHL
jgi:hypothetical protein